MAFADLVAVCVGFVARHKHYSGVACKVLFLSPFGRVRVLHTLVKMSLGVDFAGKQLHRLPGNNARPSREVQGRLCRQRVQ